MSTFNKIIFPIFVVGLWINVSETIRWIFLIESYWLDHYELLGISLPTKPINMMVWMIWGFSYAAIIFILSKKFNLWQTTILSWFVAFVMMWVVVWNVGILPTGMLWFNIPMSFVETLIAAALYIRIFKTGKEKA